MACTVQRFELLLDWKSAIKMQTIYHSGDLLIICKLYYLIKYVLIYIHFLDYNMQLNVYFLCCLESFQLQHIIMKYMLVVQCNTNTE